MTKKRKVALTVAAAGAAAWAGSKIFSKPEGRTSVPALDYDVPIILAHRGGAGLAPENTMPAFERAAGLGAHGFEIDVHLTKDEEVIVFHDETLERTTNLDGRPGDYTLAELEDADFGFRHAGEDGSYPFRGKAGGAVSLRRLLEDFPHLLINIDMKDAPDTYEGGLLPSKLWRVIEETDARHRVVVTSFHDSQIDRFNLYARNQIALGAGEQEVRRAYLAFASGFGHLYQPRADVFQIPVRSGIFPLDLPPFVRFLGRLNIPVHYWTINDRPTMERLIAAGAKGIVTDRPDLAAGLAGGPENEVRDSPEDLV
ncbi:glycerophosphodiester phosphodiesterase [Bhargavaea beijingensis]|uniref:Glycerophosphodiester phosphodiesterase n=1 Tax=Bhargavaea beijingensis TaxID=426756 RepID=A0A1G7C3P8_9BACL|nr:glycerophosphodiester phosphodiesterase [Bhargavaea beijingensis]RSK36923.1 glycerophosphodiester phosphodiesterase [Bhargavaea beijingensis]SDE33938.1 glycerophosphoryl diester phosphodiesterase [Bhargavaea beijingensis]